MDGSDQIQCIIEKQVREADPGQVYRLNAMASQMITVSKRANSNNEREELIYFNINQGSLDYKVNSNNNTRIYCG